VSCPDATYVAFVGLPSGGEGAEALVERLRHEHGLALVPGSPRWFGPGGAGHVRLCFATGEGILAEGLRRFAAGMAAAQPGRSSSG
jgi:aspartate/methionine/tyrosine aminotransferase